MRTIYIKGIKTNIGSIEEYTKIVLSAISQGKTIHITGINPVILDMSFADDSLQLAINSSDINNIDGISLALVLSLRSISKVERVACPDLFDRIISQSQNSSYKAYFLGSTDKIVSKVCANIEKKYPHIKVVGYRNGYFKRSEWDEIANTIKKLNPDFLFLGLPSPTKELFIYKYKNFINAKLYFGIGGYFDIIAGEKYRSPKYFNFFGLEWMVRLIQEPKKMFSRDLISIRTALKLMFSKIQW